MPDPQRLAKTLQQATEAFRQTPGRRGHVVVLDDAEDVLVAGDLHGHVENFRRVFARANLAQFPRRHLVLQEVIHGPFRYPTGGDKSHQLVDLVAALKCQFPERVHFLPGNHELAQMINRPIGKGDDVYNDLFREGIDSAYGAEAGKIYELYLALFAAAPLMVRTTNGVLLTHSLPPPKWMDTFRPAVLEQEDIDPAELVPPGTVHALLWGRETAAEHVASFLTLLGADLLITGHIPCEEGYEVPNERQIILDCMGSPACCCMVPANRPVTHAELVSGIQTL